MLRFSTTMDIEVLRLAPGVDLRQALEGFIRERAFPAAFVINGVGSLRRAEPRYAGRTEASVLPDACFEIIALSGTLSPDGGHLHAAFADANGAVFGGLVLTGCIVHTTAEIVIGASNIHRFSREFDPATANSSSSGIRNRASAGSGSALPWPGKPIRNIPGIPA